MIEQWKPVVGYEGLYEVSDLGRVRSLDRRVARVLGSSTTISGRVLSQTVASGYSGVSLSAGGKIVRRNVHRLVAEAFLTGEPKPQVNHISGDKQDNRLQNLEWATQSENHLHRFAVLGHEKRGGSPERPMLVRGNHLADWRRYSNSAEAARDLGLKYSANLRRAAERGVPHMGFEVRYEQPRRAAA